MTSVNCVERRVEDCVRDTSRVADLMRNRTALADNPKLIILNKKVGRWFNVENALDDEKINLAKYVRYKVYCEERGYEEADMNMTIESDEYDAHSRHSVLIHKPSGRPIGAVRIVLQDVKNPYNSMPLQTVCKDEILHSDKVLPIGRTAEMSRFCLSKSLRNHRWDNIVEGDVANIAFSPKDLQEESELLSYTNTLLIKGIIEMCVQNGVTHLCAVMEPALLRMLKGMGIEFENIGGVIDYHGRRQPCHCRLVKLIDGVKEKRPDIWSVITGGGVLAQQAAELEARYARAS